MNSIQPNQKLSHLFKKQPFLTISLINKYGSQRLVSHHQVMEWNTLMHNSVSYFLWDFLLSGLLLTISTAIVHTRRSIVLSAPRNWKTRIFKYIIIPYFYASYCNQNRWKNYQTASQIDPILEEQFKNMLQEIQKLKLSSSLSQ